MPGHIDPLYEETIDEHGKRAIKIKRDKDGNKLYPKKRADLPKPPAMVKAPEKPGEESAQELYAEDELWDMNKKDQVKVLQGHGVKGKELRALSNEQLRVDKILELQG